MFNAIIKTDLSVRVYKYDTEEIMDVHKRGMLSAGWQCRYSGKMNISPESTVTAFCDDKNWHYVAEFFKKDEIKTKEPIAYNNEGYFISVYNPIIKED